MSPGLHSQVFIGRYLSTFFALVELCVFFQGRGVVGDSIFAPVDEGI